MTTVSIDIEPPRESFLMSDKEKQIVAAYRQFLARLGNLCGLAVHAPHQLPDAQRYFSHSRIARYLIR